MITAMKWNTFALFFVALTLVACRRQQAVTNQPEGQPVAASGPKLTPAQLYLLNQVSNLTDGQIFDLALQAKAMALRTNVWSMTKPGTNTMGPFVEVWTWEVPKDYVVHTNLITLFMMPTNMQGQIAGPGYSSAWIPTEELPFKF